MLLLKLRDLFNRIVFHNAYQAKKQIIVKKIFLSHCSHILVKYHGLIHFAFPRNNLQYVPLLDNFLTLQNDACFFIVALTVFRPIFSSIAFWQSIEHNAWNKMQQNFVNVRHQSFDYFWRTYIGRSLFMHGEKKETVLNSKAF